MAGGNWTNFTEFFENFCASDFWHNESYYNDSIFPNFTPCFQQTVLVGIPALFLFVIAPIFTFQLEWRAKRRDLLPLPQSLLLLTKCILTILLSISSLIIFLRYLISWDSVEGQAFVWSPLIRFQTSAYLTHMQRRLNRFGHTSSGFVFNVTFLLLICSVPEARSWIERIFEHNLARPFDLSTCILFIIWFVSLTIYFLLQFWADPRSKDEALNVQQQASLSCSFVNRICLCWPGTLFMNDGRLQKDDLFNVDNLHESLSLFKTWNQLWIPQVKKSIRKSAKPPSIVDNLFTMFKWELISASLLRLTADLLQFTVPIFFYLFVEHLDHKNEHAWKGFAWAILIFATLQLRSFILNYSSLVGKQVGTQVKTTLNTVLYKKTLRLSLSSLETQTLNQHESNVKTVEHLFANLHIFWSPILQFGLAFILLYYLLHIVVFPVMAFVLLLVLATLCTLADENLSQSTAHSKLLNKILNNIRSIKLRGWEQPVKQLLNNYRQKEVDSRLYPNLLKHLGNSSAFVSPFALILITVLMCLTLEKEIPNRHLFIALYLIYQLCAPLNELRCFIKIVYRLFPANQRLNDYLMNEQVDRKTDQSNASFVETGSIQIENGYFSKDFQIPMPTLLDVNLDVPPGKLVAVVGENPLDSINLLHGITGELKRLDGQILVNGSIGYVSKDTWLFNTSVAENIRLVADRQDQELYEKVVEKCELMDVLNLEASNQTRKCNLNDLLTVEQKIRIALARAIYKKPDIFLFEDIAEYINESQFNEILNSLLAGKTRLFITNNLNQMRRSDMIIFVNGPSVNSGSFNQLAAAEPDFDQFVRYLEFHSTQPIEASTSSPKPTTSINKKEIDKTKNRVKWVDAYTRSVDEQQQLDNEELPLIDVGEFNRQAFKIYWDHFRSLAPVPHLFMLTAFPILMISLQLLQIVWLSDWIETDWKQEQLKEHFPFATRLAIFVLVGMSIIILTTLALHLLTTVSSKMTTTAYSQSVERILNAPVEFFTREKVDQLNWIFNNEFSKLETKIPKSLSVFGFAFIYVVVIMFLTIVIDPLMFIFALAFVVVVACLLSVYLQTAKQLSRMKQALKQSVVSSHLEASQAAFTIRTLGRTQNFAWKNNDFLDFYLRVCENKLIAEHWLQIRVLTTANWFIFLTLLSTLFTQNWGFGSTNTDWIALSLALLLNLPFFLQLFVEQLSKFDQSLIPANKLRFLSTIEQESNVDFLPAPDWPNRGEVQFENYSTYKHETTNTFLQNLSVEINAAQKVVVVGDGRAELAASFFRSVQPAGGSVFVDSLDISTIDVHKVRQQIALLPEDTLFFDNETLRFNLDPDDKFTDDQLWQVLKIVHLDESISNKWPDALSHSIDADDDFSLHQKWLLELARLLLKPSKLLVVEENLKPLDEATASTMFEILRREFADSTILIIANNFKSTLHRDVPVLLLKNGQLDGFDLPHRLLADDEPSTSQF